ncbi:NACHT, LRR and PYD domains-containing protein 3 [Anabarilius grahami]|uniref:NACHT, LRR and PYD domains-containing protein 3 n=1 Tax=Anabarilius grahami TaxID=495550 RepID=A0A3N0XH18_ANAGA|nr:NACHT, LRR and PYD domains-containing protein 3 [Anabarilius grahami]
MYVHVTTHNSFIILDWQPLFRGKDISRSHTGPNVSAAAQSGSHITAPVLTNNTITGNVHIIHNATATKSLVSKYKRRICSEYQYVTEYNSLPGEHVLLSERFTQPLILRRHRGQKEREEEICSSGESFQQVLRSRSSEDSVHLNSLFDPDNHGISHSAVILQGNSGNGKSFTVQKIMMDWASGDLYKEQFDIVFHLKCKEINRIPGKNSLAEILRYSCSLTSDQISQMLQHSPEKVLFIIDGFDELKLTEDIYHTSPNTDPLQKAPPVVTLCDLLRGRILPESFLLVTSRSTATDTLSDLLKGPQRFSEIMGFSQKGVEEYFQKFFQTEELFRKAYTFVKTNETLFTACSIPVVCWIICTTIKERFTIGADITRGLETTTSIYVDFVSTLLEHHCQGLSQSVPTLLRSLGKLAERGILEQQVLLDEKTVYGMVSNPACSPFLCKFLFKRRIHQETMFSFIHLSFQEFFTALYYVLLDEAQSKRKFRQLFSIHAGKGDFAYSPPCFAAVVQFAFGLLNKYVRRTLRKKHGLIVHPNTQAYLKNWIFKEIRDVFPRSNRVTFCLHCLYELHEDDFVREAMKAWKTIDAYGAVLRRTDCWALLYCSQCCQCIKELLLVDCQLTSEKLFMILPALHKFKKLWFICNKQSRKCTRYNDRQLSCNQEVKIHLNSQGFSMETLRNSTSRIMHNCMGDEQKAVIAHRKSEKNEIVLVKHLMLSMKCSCVPVEDRPHALLDQHFDSVAERIQQNHTGSSLVFCSAGRSRSPSLIMAYLMRFEGVSLLQAHQRVLAARPFIRPNAGFWRQLLQYKRKLTHCNSIRMVATSQGVLPEAVQLTQDSSSYCLNL